MHFLIRAFAYSWQPFFAAKRRKIILIVMIKELKFFYERLSLTVFCSVSFQTNPLKNNYNFLFGT